MDGIYFSLIFYEPISYLCHALELCEEYNESFPIDCKTYSDFSLAVIGFPVRDRSLTLPMSSKRFIVQ